MAKGPTWGPSRLRRRLMGGPCGPRPQEGARGGRGRSPEGKPRALAPSEMLKGIFDAQRCEKCTKWPLIWAQMLATFPLRCSICENEYFYRFVRYQDFASFVTSVQMRQGRGSVSRGALGRRLGAVRGGACSGASQARLRGEKLKSAF